MAQVETTQKIRYQLSIGSHTLRFNPREHQVGWQEPGYRSSPSTACWPLLAMTPHSHLTGVSTQPVIADGNPEW